MITKTEVIGTCPIGKLVKETKVDMFGYWAGERIRKFVRKDWYFEQLMQDYTEKGLTYSDLKYYAPWDDLKEVEA